MEGENSDTIDLYEKAIKLCESGKFEQTIECFDKAIEIDSEFEEAWISKKETLTIIGINE
ncbi:MAG: hypothetical protein ACFFE5_15835 [Candidatus Thorarchaeota archaeon]